MADKPLRPCRHPGCGRLVKGGWCPEHEPACAPRRESLAWHSWYSLPIWTDDLRPIQLLKEPFCRVCAARGDRVRATDVDHVTDHKGDWARFIDRDNLESLCHRCHSRKTMADLWEKRRSRQAGKGQSGR